EYPMTAFRGVRSSCRMFARNRFLATVWSGGTCAGSLMPPTPAKCQQPPGPAGPEEGQGPLSQTGGAERTRLEGKMEGRAELAGSGQVFAPSALRHGTPAAFVGPLFQNLLLPEPRRAHFKERLARLRDRQLERCGRPLALIARPQHLVQPGELER